MKIRPKKKTVTQLKKRESVTMTIVEKKIFKMHLKRLKLVNPKLSMSTLIVSKALQKLNEEAVKELQEKSALKRSSGNAKSVRRKKPASS